MSHILVTGGAGYIGSHTVIELINHGFKVVIADNLSNSSYDAVARIEYIVKQQVPFVNVDLNDYDELNKVFEKYPIKGVIHFAAKKAVGESTKIPLEYYDNNIGGTITLLKVMKNNNVKTVVFSSSATVYGDATRFENMIPIPEHCPNDPTNPYGKTKYMIENIIKDIYGSDNSWRSAILRYFNPIGAHPSGLIGEDPLGIPNNLLPYLAQVAIGRREKLSIFGSDYNSHDGTPIRDYIHVVDLAKGHIAALTYLNNLEKDSGLFREWNLGTGKGSTVFDVYHAFCKAVGRELPYEVVGRRDGDVLDLTANPTRANEELKWKAELSIDEACAHLWKWTTENPFGFSVDNYKWEVFNDDKTDYTNRLHTVTFDNGFTVSLANRGAIMQKILKHGQSLTLGFDDPKRYYDKSNPFFGTTVGRVANRIGDSKFELNGKTYKLDSNEGKNTLHGGPEGFDKQIFMGPIAKQTKKDGKTINTFEFSIKDADGHNGFPGDIVSNIKYTIDDESIGIEFTGELLDESPVDSTIFNLTNHSYFTISDAETIDNTVVKSITSKQLEVNDALLPTGNIVPAYKDITKPTELNPETDFDFCFVVKEDGCKSCDTRNDELLKVFEATHPNSKVKFVVETTDPAFQFYAGAGIAVDGLKPRSGFCIENGRFVNAINHDKWRNQVIVKKGETYGSKVKYSFVDV